ncbi:MAG: HEAT repeat domain-containing protein [Verrucomicrobiales bacterium]|nr:HEAT repeat domain-containing protein [Verrucomicrobiales bacterium]
MGVKRVMDPLLRQLRRFGGPILIILLLIGAFPTGPKQLPPVYADMPANYWISQLDLPSGTRHPRTLEALSAIHKHCLYELESRLKSFDSRLRNLMIRVSSFFPRGRVAFPKPDLDLRRQAAAEVVAACGSEAAVLADPLVTGLQVARSPNTVEAIENALLTLGPAAIRPLSALSLGADEPSRARALHALSRIIPRHSLSGESQRDLATVAASQAGSHFPELALAAYELLTALTTNASHVLPSVLPGLEHPSPLVRTATARFIGQLAREPGLCVPPLTGRVQRDADEATRTAAAQSLGRFGSHAAAAVDALVNCIQSHSTATALAAIQSLGRIGAPAATAVDALAASLRDPRSEVRAGSAVALGRIGLTSPAVIQGLSDRLSDDDDYVRLSAVRSLTAFGPGAEPAVDALIRALSDPVESIRVSATDALGAIGPTAARARPHLQAARNNNQSVMSQPVLAALHRIDSPEAPGVLRSDGEEDKPAR